MRTHFIIWILNIQPSRINAYPSGAHECALFLWGSCCWIFGVFLGSVLWIIVCPFVFFSFCGSLYCLSFIDLLNMIIQCYLQTVLSVDSKRWRILKGQSKMDNPVKKATRRRKTKQKHNMICVGQHYSQTNTTYNVNKTSSSLAKGYDPLYSSSPLASLDGFSRSHGDGLYVMQLVVAATNQNGLYKKHMFCRKNVNKIKMRKIFHPARFW